jgi:hypothetical protein
MEAILSGLSGKPMLECFSLSNSLKMEMYYNSVAGSWFSCAVIKEKAIN